MPSYETTELLKTIQAGDPDTVYWDVCKKAAVWALCGFMDEANHLLDVLWKYDRKNFDKDPRMNKGFQVMWEVSGTAPKTEIPFELGDIEKIEKENLDYFLKSYGTPVIEGLDKPLAETPVDALFVKSIFFYNTKRASREEIIGSLKKFIQESKHATEYTYFQAASSGCLLAAHHGNEDLLFEFMALWATGYLKYAPKYDATYLMSDRSMAGALLSGFFAGKLSITKLDCQADTRLLEDALKKRSEKGRTLIYGHMDWQELLKRISLLSIQQEELEFPAEVIEKQWLGFEPATLDDIRLKEATLGIRFPQDYIDFLLTTNGFMACRNTFPTLCSINEVGFLRDIEPNIIDCCDSESDGESLVNSFRNGIFIGGLHDEQQMFLGPVEHGQWVCWFFASWLPGEWQFQSLRYYMEYVLRELEEKCA
jgi:SMI1 / KNR4 family (SUKH-1)